MECGWIKEQLAEIDRQEGYPSAKSASDFLTLVLRDQDSYSDFSEKDMANGATARRLLEDDAGQVSNGDMSILDGVNLDFGMVDEGSIGGVTVFRPYT